MVERYQPQLPAPQRPYRYKYKPKINGNGDKRKGGRPPGRRNDLSNEQRKAAARTGELPHQFMLKVMRLGPGGKVGNYILEWADIQWAAQHAAPYYAARLASLQIKPDGKPAIVIQLDPDKLKNLNEAELSKLLASLIQMNAPNTINGEVVPSVNPDQDIEDIDPDLYEATLG